MAQMFASPSFRFQRRWLFVALLLSAALLLAGSRAMTGHSQTPGLSITAWTVDGGGGLSTGGGFSIYGVAGQPDAAPALTGGGLTLYPGFLHPAAAAPGGSNCPNQSDIVTAGNGAHNAIWCGANVARTLLDGLGGAGGAPMSAIFSWDNGNQRFLFWFRGFPDTFQTLPDPALTAGNAYFFQTTGPATLPQGAFPPFTLDAANTANFTTNGAGAYAVVWSGMDHSNTSAIGNTFLNTGQETNVSAIFQWDNTGQRFNFWFRGFPANFQTLPSGVERGKYYFFQVTSATNFVMN